MIYESGKTIQGDCLEVMKYIASGSVDMILCDLPYGTTQNKWDSVIPLDNLWEQYRRIIKANGVIALSAQGIFTAKLILSQEAWFKYKFVWVKSKSTNFLNARKQPLRQHEDICIFYGKQPDYQPVMWRGEAIKHSYQAIVGQIFRISVLGRTYLAREHAGKLWPQKF